MLRLMFGLAGCLLASGAQAQSLAFAPFTDSAAALRASIGQTPLLNGPINPARDFVALSRQRILDAGDPTATTGFGFISVGSLLAASGGVSQAQMSSALVGIATRIDRLQSRFSEGVALAGSINVLPPNEGDRFAVSFGGAGYDGVGAGSVAVSARVGDAIVYGALARGPTQSLVKGGVGWSFR